MSGAPWWHYVLGIAVVVVLLILRLSPDIYEMVQQRKERKLWGYDKTQFAEKAGKDDGD